MGSECDWNDLLCIAIAPDAWPCDILMYAAAVKWPSVVESWLNPVHRCSITIQVRKTAIAGLSAFEKKQASSTTLRSKSVFFQNNPGKADGEDIFPAPNSR